MSTNEYERDIPSKADASVDQRLDQRAAYAAVRQELAGDSPEELEAIVAPRFMFRSDCPPEIRARITLRQRVAQDILDGKG